MGKEQMKIIFMEQVILNHQEFWLWSLKTIWQRFYIFLGEILIPWILTIFVIGIIVTIFLSFWDFLKRGGHE